MSGHFSWRHWKRMPLAEVSAFVNPVCATACGPRRPRPMTSANKIKSLFTTAVDFRALRFILISFQDRRGFTVSMTDELQCWAERVLSLKNDNLLTVLFLTAQFVRAGEN